MIRTIHALRSLRRVIRRPAGPLPTAAAVIGFGVGVLGLGLLLGRRRRPGAPELGPETETGARGPVTQSTVAVNPADAHMGEPGLNEEERLDEGIQESFPGSDPVSVRIE